MGAQHHKVTTRDSGIYAIVCVATCAVYVGSSVRIADRWSMHRSQLRAGTHENRHLQHAWVKYGEDSFVFRVLEFIHRTELVEREQFFIDRAPRKYNLQLIAGPRGPVSVAGQADYGGNKHPLLVEFEHHTGLGPVAAAKSLGCAYPTYAQYRSRLRNLPRYYVTHVKAVMRLTPEILAEHLQEILDGSR